MTRAHVALGSNLGDREALLCDARAALEAAPGVTLLAASGLFETEPVGLGPQGRYLNAALALETGLGASALLELLHTIERAGGRVRSAERNLARTLDLDLLFFGELRSAAPELELPHPRLHERAFVLVPLTEIAPEVVHPGLGVTVGALAERVAGRERVVPYAARRWRPLARR